MAHKNITRTGKAHLKKTVSLMSVKVGANDADTFNDINNNYLVGYLPPNAVITNATVLTKVVSDAATVIVGTTEAGTEILSAGDTSSTGFSGTFAGPLDTDTGVAIYIKLGFAVTTGDVRVLISYDEYDLNNGAMTMVDNV